MSHKIFHSAIELPIEFDKLDIDNPYLKREFLTFVEKTETEYKPDYHLFFDGDKLDSCFIAFKKRNYNVAMFTKFKFKINVTLIYLPMCVTRGGFYFGKMRKEALDVIKTIKGYKMLLNAEIPSAEGFAVGLTCPKCILNVRWNTFNEYLSNLRSDYRHHVKKILKKAANIELKYIRAADFNDQLYQCYLNVLGNSKIKIETLSKEYFKGPNFILFAAYLNGIPVGFTQLLPNNDELIFEFVGVDYKYNKEYAIYHRMLFEIIDYGIKHQYQTIDFGQTADDTKLKLGCKYTYLYAYFHHSNKLINWFCKKLGKTLEYKPLETKFKPFKEE